MFGQEALDAYLLERGVTDPGRAYIRRVRSTPPSRSVGSSARNVTCRFASRKMRRSIQAESHTGELPAIWIWEFDSATYEFWDQPEPTLLPIINRAGRLTNQLKTADFLLLQRDFVGWVECKPLSWLEREASKGNPNYRQCAEGRWHYVPGEQVAACWGMGYVIRLAEENNQVLVDNLSFLSDYLSESVADVPNDRRAEILALLGSSGWIRLCDLVRAPGIASDDVYALIAGRDLYVDVEADRISEIERCFVFRDRDAAIAYRLVLKVAATSELPDLTYVDLASGSKIVWDGNVWTIANAGEHELTLVDGSMASVMPRDVMQRLIGEGRVLANPAAPNAKSRRAAERLAKANDAERAQAVKRQQALFPPPGSKVIDIPGRTLRAWRRAWHLGMELYGVGFIGLLPNIHKRGNRKPKLPSITLEIVEQVGRTRFLSEESPSISACYGIARLQCLAAGTVAPSPSTFSRKVHLLATEADRVRARHGDKAAYQVEAWYWNLEPDTPRHGQRPLEIAHLDHTQIDLQLRDERFERMTRKCWVTALIDAYSRLILAIFVSFDSPSYRSCMMVIRECVRRHGRVPSTIVVDWGSDFRSEYFEQLLAYLVIHKKHRPKGSPRHGAVIERVFKRMNEDLIHNLRGNNKGLQNPRILSRSHDPRERAIWTIERFGARLLDYIDNVYAQQPHGSLGVSPRHAFDLGLRDFGGRAERRIVYDEAFRMICLPSVDKGTARVRPGGAVKINYAYYSAPALVEPGCVGRDLQVRYDPFNMAVAYAFVQGSWIQLRSQYESVFRRYSEREIKAASEQIREKNGGTYKRRHLSAETIARHLLRMEQEEAAMLAQTTLDQLRDGSLGRSGGVRAQSQGSGDMVATPEQLVDENLFDNLPIEYYGDIE